MKELINIAKKIKQINKTCYVVWWYCRDKVLWVERTKDIDLCTNALPQEISSVLTVVSEVWSKYWTFIVKEWEKVFEITTFRKDIGSINFRRPAQVDFTDSLYEDSLRRDFTINAIYYDILKDELIDPVWWINDLRNWIISFVWNIEDRLDEDILRVLRYVRFKNTLWLKAKDFNYKKIIKSKLPHLQNIAIERVKHEFDKILISHWNIDSLTELKDIWFFKLFLNDVDKLESTPGWARWHLEWNVWSHTLLCINVLNNMNLSSLWYVEDEIIDLYWCVLIHDIWKNYTYTFDENKFVHYYWHEEKSAQIFIEKISNKFLFSNISKERIHWLLLNHLNAFKVLNMRKIKWYHTMMHKYFEYLLVISEADHLWRIPSDKSLLIEIKNKYKTFKEKIKHVQFYNWNDIMKKYPELKWREIWERIKQLNDNLLAEI